MKWLIFFSFFFFEIKAKGLKALDHTFTWTLPNILKFKKKEYLN